MSFTSTRQLKCALVVMFVSRSHCTTVAVGRFPGAVERVDDEGGALAARQSPAEQLADQSPPPLTLSVHVPDHDFPSAASTNEKLPLELFCVQVPLRRPAVTVPWIVPLRWSYVPLTALPCCARIISAVPWLPPVHAVCHVPDHVMIAAPALFFVGLVFFVAMAVLWVFAVERWNGPCG